MENIDVECRETDTGWSCEVELKDASTSTHTVSVPESDYESLTSSSDVDVEALVEGSFNFLLDREPQSAIMSSFDIMTIETYFPEYPNRIVDYF